MKHYLKQFSLVVFLLIMSIAAYWQIDSYYEAKIYREVSMVMKACQAAIETKASIEIAPPRQNKIIAEKAMIEAPGIKVVIDKEDNWQTVAMLLVTLLGSYLGIKIINRLFKE